MKRWSAAEAAAQFDHLVEACLVEGPQIVDHSIHGSVLLSPLHRRAERGDPVSLKHALLSPEGRTEMLIPPRGQLRRRPTVELES